MYYKRNRIGVRVRGRGANAPPNSKANCENAAFAMLPRQDPGRRARVWGRSSVNLRSILLSS